MTDDETIAARNLLDGESSPYLLQHAGNPVHWRPWSAAALREARQSGRPILLSIGYAACHWCHVMAHESFEDAETAALMNALFVNIKVDREERPDIDHLYMSALHALGEQGGWPLTMFLDPDGRPFWGGTYFPPTARWGRPSFQQVLRGVSDAFANQADAIGHNRTAIGRALAAMVASRPGDPPGPAALDRAAGAYLRMIDREAGGLRGAPKFPNAPVFRFLWQNAFRTPAFEDAAEARTAMRKLLSAMSAGGIYDHLGGGYARYSTDAEWLVPHFEKMLYDNAQILELLALAHADAPDPLFAARAEETVGWLTRDMAVAVDDGAGLTAFAASEDADSEGEEGKFYVWTEREVDAVLGDDAGAFKANYDVMAGGNWEGVTVLRRVLPLASPDDEARLARARETLLRARADRVRPGRDDKVLADWNGLAIHALARAAAAFDRPAWLDVAEITFAAIDRALGGPAGRLGHAWRLGRVSATGLLDDHAALARAALALFEATGDTHYLDRASTLADAAIQWFADLDGSFFTSAADASDVPLGPEARPRSVADNATPSGNGLMAEVFARLYHLTGEARWRERAEAILRAFGGLGDGLSGAPTLLAAADLLEDGVVVVVAGPDDDERAASLHTAALCAPDPVVCVMRVTDTAALASNHPAQGKPAASAVAYVCRAGACERPLHDPDALAQRLRMGRTPSA